MAEMAARVDQLQDQVNALTELLYEQQKAQQQAQADAAQTQAALQTAAAQAQAAQAAQIQAEAQIKTIPAQVKTEVAANAYKPKPSWADSTTISGRMYYDVSALVAESNGVKQAPGGAGLDIKRFYLGVDHRFNDTFSGNLTTDVQYSSAISSTELYIKKAYLQAKLNDALTLRIGAADLPWVPFAEDAYGYRFLEQTVIDRTKYGTSSDWGVHAFGRIPNTPISYGFAVLNGAGYKAPLRSSAMDIEGRVSAAFKNGITVAVGGYTGKLGKDIQGGAPTFHTANRLDALAVYAKKRFRIGVELFSAEDWNNVASVVRDKSAGYSVFGNYNITDQISAFARYDHVEPTRSTAPARDEGYYNIGINWEPVKIIDFALVYKHDRVDHGVLNTGNGLIGGSRGGTYKELGLFGQFRF